MIWGWAGTLGAALCYGVASVAQAVGVRALAQVGRGVALRARMWAGRWYGIGLGLDGAGFVASVAALQWLPLFVVQAGVAASVGVTALTARVVLRARLSRLQIGALVVLAGGLAALASAAPVQSPRVLSDRAGWIFAAGVLALAAVTVAAYLRRHSRWSFPVLAGCAGLGYAAVGIAARVLVVPHPWWAAIRTPPVWAIAGYGAVSIIAFALALSRGPVTVATAWALAIETVIPAVVGVAVLGDRIRAGHGVVATAGFIAVVLACLGLAGRAHPEPSGDDLPAEH